MNVTMAKRWMYVRLHLAHPDVKVRFRRLNRHTVRVCVRLYGNPVCAPVDVQLKDRDHSELWPVIGLLQSLHELGQ